MRVLTKIASAFCGLSLLVIAPCHAQEMPLEMREQLGKRLNINPNDPAFLQKLNERGGELRVSKEQMRMAVGKFFGVNPEMVEMDSLGTPNALKTPARNTTVPMVIYRRYNFGDGAPLNAGDKTVTANHSKGLVQSREQVAKFHQQSIEFAKQVIKQQSRSANIPSCDTGSYEAAEYHGEPKILDMLALVDKVPLNPDLEFGQDTRVFQYKPNSLDSDSLLISMAGPRCLPYRVRIANGKRTEYYGRDALRNFDPDAAKKYRKRR